MIQISSFKFPADIGNKLENRFHLGKYVRKITRAYVREAVCNQTTHISPNHSRWYQCRSSVTSDEMNTFTPQEVAYMNLAYEQLANADAIENVWRSIQRRFESCVRVNNRNFEHLL